MPSGVLVEDVATAELPFAPIMPTVLGIPEKVVLTPPSTPLPSTEMAWVFDLPGYGRFLVLEHVAERRPTQAEFRELAAQEPGCREIPLGDSDTAGMGPGAGPRIECHMGIQYFVT